MQTRRGDDPVVRGLEHGEFDALIDDDVTTAKLLALPPYGAVANVSGEAAADFVSLLGAAPVSVHEVANGFVVRARDVDTLATALRSVARPAGRVRVAVE